jgi:hypothetical protein
MPSEPSSSPSTPGSASKPRRPSNIDVAYSSRGTDITISVPYEPKRSGDRRRVMEKARRMLAIALEEEARAGENAQDVQASPKNRLGRKPGTGAWWMF